MILEYNFFSEIYDIDYKNFDISNVPYKDMFDYIYKFSPITIRKHIDSLKRIDQRPDYHPEGNVYIHTKVVTNRLSKTKDINLILSGFLHDTGKDRTTETKDGIIRQPGHEKYSAELLNVGSPWRKWISLLGGNPYIVKFIISKHMIMKNLIGNKKNQRWFDSLNSRLQKYLIDFSKADKGGVDI